MSISVNPAGSASPWSGNVNLRLAVAELVSQATESVLADLGTATGANPAPVPGTPVGGALGQILALPPGAGLPVLPADPIAAGPLPASHGSDRLALPEDWFESSVPAKAASAVEEIEPAEAAASTASPKPILADDMPLPAQNDFIPQSAASARIIHADLKTSPWLEQGLNTAAIEPQRLSSVGSAAFEALPLQSLSAEVAAGAVLARPAPAWPSTNWPELKLEDQRMRELPLLIAPPVAPLQPALLRVRFKAVLVDGALTLAVVLAASLVATLHLEDIPSFEAIALSAMATAAILAALYQILFLAIGQATPGMKAAHLALRTFANEPPTRAQRSARLGALILSLLPAGLGVLWVLFDHDRLSLHDRLSRTYLRNSFSP